LAGVGVSGDISHALEVMVLGMSILELWFHEPALLLVAILI
jgi:hypothetical protein